MTIFDTRSYEELYHALKVFFSAYCSDTEQAIRAAETCVSALRELDKVDREKYAQRERSADQMHLGELISQLKTLNKTHFVSGLGTLRSYRGYYSDLAFEPDERKKTVGKVLEECMYILGRIFSGYKGGEFSMDGNTPLWIAEYGNASGIKLVGLDTSSDVIKPITKKQEDEEW